MIIVGYQGIGKSSLARGGSGFIDLESGNFWVDGRRDEHWAQVYANMAIHLSQQGYTVFTSSHAVVRECLRNHPDIYWDCTPRVPELLAVCYPALELKEPWIQKLEERYNRTHLDKDYKAWRNAAEMYDENIKDLMSEKSPVIHIKIDNMNYCLRDLLKGFYIDTDMKGAGTLGV